MFSIFIWSLRSYNLFYGNFIEVFYELRYYTLSYSWAYLVSGYSSIWILSLGMSYYLFSSNLGSISPIF